MTQGLDNTSNDATAAARSSSGSEAPAATPTKGLSDQKTALVSPADATTQPDDQESASSDDTTAKHTDDASTTEAPKQPQGSPQSFAQAVFPGFNPPKITTPAFFSSMQGKIQSTLAGAPALNLQPPQINKVDIKQIQASTEQLANQTKDWGMSAFKSLSSAAQRVSANVTQGIQKEHDDFVRQKKIEVVVPRQGTEVLPAWTGLPDEEKIKARILSLSKDKRNFLLPPPPGTDFVFDMNAYSSTAVATLKQDPNLEKMRFYLVPREVEELVFWRNYFYRVSLLKQVALAAAAGAPDALADAASGSTSTTRGFTEGAEVEGGSNNGEHTRPLSAASALGYNIYFGKDDVAEPPRRSRPNSTVVKDSGSSAAATAKESKAAAKKAEKKAEVLFESNMPDHDEDPDAWLEKQLASGATIGDGGDDADVDVGDWEKELQNELKDYVEGA
ncbi:Synapse-associated protein 1 [Dissophora globulifera]|uniref:Synapse-associated protein 1 n=1 Tax=Dissophora globulifera TaxID=979702 RepID=A0A9P6RNX4_9FUNG|nr:Synapse-associated protein 1 [Dissophora globulifera]